MTIRFIRDPRCTGDQGWWAPCGADRDAEGRSIWQLAQDALSTIGEAGPPLPAEAA